MLTLFISSIIFYKDLINKKVTNKLLTIFFIIQLFTHKFYFIDDLPIYISCLFMTYCLWKLGFIGGADLKLIIFIIPFLDVEELKVYFILLPFFGLMLAPVLLYIESKVKKVDITIRTYKIPYTIPIVITYWMVVNARP